MLGRKAPTRCLENCLQVLPVTTIRASSARVLRRPPAQPEPSHDNDLTPKYKLSV